jgi:hypothetical protein
MVVNDLFKFDKSKEMIIRLPPSSEKYLSFTQLTFSYTLEGSIHPDARFLFANLKRINFEQNHDNDEFTCMFSLEDQKSMLDLFKENGCKLLEFVKFRFDYSNTWLEEFVDYPIKSIVLSSYEDYLDRENC